MNLQYGEREKTVVTSEKKKKNKKPLFPMAVTDYEVIMGICNFLLLRLSPYFFCPQLDPQLAGISPW